jgi:hypothetical protein
MNRAYSMRRWHTRCICIHIDFASTPQLSLPAPELTEDPPFGGLWCDQPALFLPARNARG